MDRDTAVIKAVNMMKSCDFKATAIKVELEANLHRDWDEDQCYDYMMENLELLGLTDGFNWCGALKYAQFYNDGSVDSEFTFTLSLKDPKTVFLLPRIIEVWNDLCNECGDGNSQMVAGAGMHMALMNDPKCYYPGRISEADSKRFVNFKKSMTLMLPALYFLATHNHISRRLSCRMPIIKTSNAEHGSDKHNAITYKGGALEFRVFDTCYDQPMAILDNIVVMANSMKYWTNRYKDPGLSKIADHIRFGHDGSRELERFYCTVAQIDLLNAGLELLKPSYKTITQLKAERNFTVDRHKIANAEREIVETARLEYGEYEERFMWRLELDNYYRLADYMQSEHDKDRKAGMYTIKRRANERLQAEMPKYMSRKKNLDQYIEDKIRNFNGRNIGDFELAV